MSASEQPLHKGEQAFLIAHKGDDETALLNEGLLKQAASVLSSFVTFKI